MRISYVVSGPDAKSGHDRCRATRPSLDIRPCFRSDESDVMGLALVRVGFLSDTLRPMVHHRCPAHRYTIVLRNLSEQKATRPHGEEAAVDRPSQVGLGSYDERLEAISAVLCTPKPFLISLRAIGHIRWQTIPDCTPEAS